MENELLGILATILIPVIVRIVLHRYLRPGFPGNLFSALVSSFVFQMTNYFWLGYLEPFFTIAFVVGVVIAFLISSIVEDVLVKKGW